jgi:hypothetical protein
MSRTYVDISRHNGTPNLKAYRDAGYTDLMLKATEGTAVAWLQMQALAREWHSFGPRYRAGYYHWLYGTLSASAQFTHFWSIVAPVWRTGDWLMVDFEDVDPSRWVPDAVHLAVLSKFYEFAMVRGETHIYAPDWYLSSLPACRAWLVGRLVVASDYSHSPPLNRYGLTFVAHQYTSRATVPGFAGPVDCNRWLIESTSGGGIEIPGEDALTPEQMQELSKLIADTGAATADRVHRDLAGTLQRVVDIAAAVSGDTIAIHAAQYLSGGRVLPDGPGINLPGLEANMRAAINAAVAAPGGTRVPLKIALEGTAE